ncbi:phosphatase PAP2 family protein [uncultured Pontibacter sp.]|uniref:phosphatase PAP2 family protein n=1 Tax=uncultured Pontibacter sp. TaxID=453356 RepID=UPI002638243F|nr:phosphatase PAP2 family protein [uncultured Pontibacter sp.]
MKNPLSHKVRRAKRWFLEQSPVRSFQQKFPRVAAFIGNRFYTKSFVGLPLTLLLVVAYVNVSLLSELTESVMDAEWIVVTDHTFTSQLYSARSPWLSEFFFMLTKLGERNAVFVVGAVATGIFLYRRRYAAIVVFWIVMAGLGLSVRYGKTFISRARPADVAYYEVEHYSFPSGHATTALALYGLLAYFLYRHYNKSPYRNLYLWLAFILTLLVGFSRIYLGVHYLSDVLAGYLLGLLWMLVGISLVEVMMYRKNKAPLNNRS